MVRCQPFDPVHPLTLPRYLTLTREKPSCEKGEDTRTHWSFLPSMRLQFQFGMVVHLFQRLRPRRKTPTFWNPFNEVERSEQRSSFLYHFGGSFLIHFLWDNLRTMSRTESFRESVTTSCRSNRGRGVVLRSLVLLGNSLFLWDWLGAQTSSVRKVSQTRDRHGI